MKTPAACKTYQATSEFSDCSFIDPLYNVKFDLSKLNRKDGYLVENNGTEFKFNVCGAVDECDGGICRKSGVGVNFKLTCCLMFNFTSFFFWCKIKISRNSSQNKDSEYWKPAFFISYRNTS